MYEPATGRFTTLDPFFGNLQEPQSFHKYLYTHGDPVNGVDPTGMFSLAAHIAGMAVHGGIQATHSIAVAVFGAEITAGLLAGYFYGAKYGQRIRQIRNQPPPPIEDYHYALLAQAVYDPAPDVIAATGWAYEDHFTDAASGMRAVLFSKGTRHIISFAGTTFTSIEDWRSNIGQGLYGRGAQYDQVPRVVQRLKHGEHNTRNYDIERFVGHSLGGGLASLASLQTGKPATTFNAAGLHRLNTDPYPQNFAQASTLIHAYRVFGDPLSALNDAEFPTAARWAIWTLETRLEKIVELIENAPNSIGRTTWLEPTAENPVMNHVMVHVLAGMQKLM